MFWLFFVCVCLPPYPDWVDTMLSPLRSLLDVAELASQSHSLLVLLIFILVAFLCLFVKRSGESQEVLEEKRDEFLVVAVIVAVVRH